MAGGEEVVIIAYDGSPAARQAVVESAKILAACEILVVTVWEEGLSYTAAVGPDVMMPTMPPAVDPDTAQEVNQALLDRAERVSHEGATLARSLGLNAQPLALPDDESNPARTILTLAQERRAAVIVTGSRGHSGLRARLEGSTSAALLKHASCPVLVVHETDEEPAKAG